MAPSRTSLQGRCVASSASLGNNFECFGIKRAKAMARQQRKRNEGSSAIFLASFRLCKLIEVMFVNVFSIHSVLQASGGSKSMDSSAVTFDGNMTVQATLHASGGSKSVDSNAMIFDGNMMAEAEIIQETDIAESSAVVEDNNEASLGVENQNAPNAPIGATGVVDIEDGPSFSLGSAVERMVVENLEEEAHVENQEECMENQDQTAVVKPVDRRFGKKPLKIQGFKDLDPMLLEKVNSVSSSSSETTDNWARGRFDGWRLHTGLTIDRKIEEIPLNEFADQLERFILCVQRQDGTRFPPETLQNLYRTFNRILRRAQDLRILNTRQDEKIIDIFHDVLFAKARKALEVAMQESAAAGSIRKRKTVDILSRADQIRILAHPMHQVGVNTCLQKRYAFYCMTRFLIRGGKELCKVRDFQFNVGKDFVRDYIEYCETTSKNWTCTINKCKTEDFRQPVRCYEPDVINTWKLLLSHLPNYEVKDKIGGRFIFLSAINRPRSNIWYQTNHASQKAISNWLNDMVSVCNIEGHFTNKSCRHTAITQMSVSGVPIEVGMAITGHKNPESYKRYDKSGVVAKASAMDVLSSGKKYSESFQANVENLNVGLAGTSAGKAAGLSKPLSDVTNSLPPILEDDEYTRDFAAMLEQRPELKYYFPDVVSDHVGTRAADSSSKNIILTGNKIEHIVINVGSMSEAGALAEKLKNAASQRS